MVIWYIYKKITDTQIMMSAQLKCRNQRIREEEALKTSLKYDNY
jgi:cytidylate kinase